jgi:hypothetical protein
MGHVIGGTRAEKEGYFDVGEVGQLGEATSAKTPQKVEKSLIGCFSLHCCAVWRWKNPSFQREILRAPPASTNMAEAQKIVNCHGHLTYRASKYRSNAISTIAFELHCYRVTYPMLQDYPPFHLAIQAYFQEPFLGLKAFQVVISTQAAIRPRQHRLCSTHHFRRPSPPIV